MLKSRSKNKFEKDVEKMRKRGKDLEKLRVIMLALIEEKTLAYQYKDHPLKGDYSGCRECHIEPDWLLVYFVDKDTITFVRTGTHADLF